MFYRKVLRRPWVTGIVLAGLWLGVTSSGCEDLLTIPVETSAKATVDGNAGLGGLLSVLPFDDLTTFDISDSSELQNQGVGPDDIESVILTDFTLTVESPEGQDLSFFDSIEFFVEADGLDRVRIASLFDFPEGESQVSLDLDDVDIVDYVVAESMEITTDVSATVPAETTTIRADVAFDVLATVTGACNAIKEEASKDE